MAAHWGRDQRPEEKVKAGCFLLGSFLWPLSTKYGLWHPLPVETVGSCLRSSFNTWSRASLHPKQIQRQPAGGPPQDVPIPGPQSPFSEPRDTVLWDWASAQQGPFSKLASSNKSSFPGSLHGAGYFLQFVPAGNTLVPVASTFSAV